MKTDMNEPRLVTACTEVQQQGGGVVSRSRLRARARDREGRRGGRQRPPPRARAVGAGALAGARPVFDVDPGGATRRLGMAKAAPGGDGRRRRRAGGASAAAPERAVSFSSPEATAPRAKRPRLQPEPEPTATAAATKRPAALSGRLPPCVVKLAAVSDALLLRAAKEVVLAHVGPRADCPVSRALALRLLAQLVAGRHAEATATADADAAEELRDRVHSVLTKCHQMAAFERTKAAPGRLDALLAETAAKVGCAGCEGTIRSEPTIRRRFVNALTAAGCAWCRCLAAEKQAALAELQRVRRRSRGDGGGPAKGPAASPSRSLSQSLLESPA